MRKPAVIRFGRFGGIRNRLRSRSYTPCILDPSPLSFPLRYSPLPTNAIPLSPPIIGPRTSDAQTAFSDSVLASTLLHNASYQNELGGERAAGLAVDPFGEIIRTPLSASALLGSGGGPPYVCDPGIKQESCFRGGIGRG